MAHFQWDSLFNKSCNSQIFVLYRLTLMMIVQLFSLCNYSKLQIMYCTHNRHNHPHQSLHLCPCRQFRWQYWKGLLLLQVVRHRYAAPAGAWKWLWAPCQVRGCPWDGPEGPGELVSDWEPPKPPDSLSRTCGGDTGIFKEFPWFEQVFCL